MCSERKHVTARDKLNAILRVYQHGESVAHVCRDLNISRVTFYDWLNQLKTAIQPIWGGLAKNPNSKKVT